MSILSESGVSIEYMYAYAVGEIAPVIMKVSNVQKKAIEVLKGTDLELACAKEICNN